MRICPEIPGSLEGSPGRVPDRGTSKKKRERSRVRDLPSESYAKLRLVFPFVRPFPQFKP